MQCPHCHAKNLLHAAICTHCGIILRPLKNARSAPKYRPNAAEVTKGVLLANKYRAQHALVAARLHDALSSAQERYEKDLKHDQPSPHLRFHLGTTHLLKDEIARGVEDLEQARQGGLGGAAFYNNLGVALARRGSLTRSVEAFERAIRHDAAAPAPHANLAHVYAQVCTGPDPEAAEHALRQVQALLKMDGRNPTHYNRLGLILVREHRYDEAIVHFDHAKDLAAETPLLQADALNNRGIAQWLCGDHAEATASFAAALRLDPGHGHALSNQGLAAMREGDTDGAFKKLHKAAKLDPKNALVQTNLGCLLGTLGAVNEAILACKEAIACDGQVFEATYNLGKAYADQGLTENAEASLTRAVQCHPRSWQALVTFGVVKAQGHQISHAIQCFQSADRITHNNALIQTNLGVCLALEGKHREAERHLHQAGAIDKRAPDIPAHLGWLALLQDDLTRALEGLEIALSRNDQIAEAHNNYGLCLLAQVQAGHEPDKAEAALRHFHRALTLNPEYGQIHYQIGSAHALLNQREAAVKAWERAAQAEPTNADCFANLGVALYQRGAFDDAVTHFRHVIALRQTRVEDFSNLGLAYAKQGVALRAASRRPHDARDTAAVEKCRQAVAMFDRALTFEPRNVMLHSNRGLACYFANRPEEAMQEWATVTKLDPEYARRRGKAQQTEFDDSPMHLVPLRAPERGLQIPLRTAEYLSRFVPGYDTDEWDLMLTDPHLTSIPEMSRRSRHLERSLHALQL